ncbi:MAG: sugar ABC transporter ATP-binding protein [Lachnospiraceae bacterium]
MDVPILELQNIVKIYGGTKALDNACLKIQLGEVHALMGGNGAGKSTIIGIVAGSKKADGGKIIYKGQEVNFKTPRDALQKGIAVVYQELSLIPHLTIAENIAMIREEVHSSPIFKWKEACSNAQKALDMLGEAAKELKPEDIVRNLRADQKQMVELARALSLDAKIILLDEPTSSLNFIETQQLFEVIRSLCKQGIGVIFVSHKMDELREIADRITIFRNGSTVVEGALMSDKSDDEIIEDMLGRKMESLEKINPEEYLAVDKAPVLMRIKYDGVKSEIVLHEGEIIGLAGLAGSGRSSLLRCLWGADKRSDIHITFNEKPFTPKSPKDALNNQLAYISEDRNLGGLFHVLPMLETIIMPYRVLKNKRLIKNYPENEVFDEAIDHLKIKISDQHAVPVSLSGGNQQKLLFGRWLRKPPKIFLLDDPTRGVDVYTKQDIYRLIKNNAKQNKQGVIVVSSELAELSYMCHKVFIMRDGVPKGMIQGREITEANMMAHVTSSSGNQESEGK